ncbi:hypothetical protein Tco_1132208, partial [Tanacetum coccineum]
VIPEVPTKVPIVPADPLVASEVVAVSITSPARVLDLVDYSSSDFDPLEDSLPSAPALPLVLPFLCSDDSKTDSKFVPAEQRPERHESFSTHDVMVSRWRDRVTSRSSSPSGSPSQDTFAPSFEFLFAPVVSPPGIRQQPAILILPEEAIPFGRTYRTHPNGPRSTLDSSHSGLSSDSSSDTSLGSPSNSLSDTSSVHSSGYDTSGQAHSGPSTRVASSRLVYLPVITPRYSEAFRRWRSEPLSTPYPPTTSESSLDLSSKRSLDLSSLSARPSRKRCRSPTTAVPSSTPVLRMVAPTHVGLLPPHKRFRDSYSPKDSKEEHMEVSTADAEAVVDLGIGDGVGAHTEDGIGMGVEIDASNIREDNEEFEAEIMASEERASLADRIKRLGRENLRVQALLCIERDCVDSLHHHMALSQEEFCHIHRDRDDSRRRLRRLVSFVERCLGFRPYFGSTMDMTIRRSGMTPEAIKELIAQRVAEALANLRQPVLLTLSRLKVKAKMTMTAMMEMVEMGMETMEVEETTELEIQMRMVEVLCQLLIWFEKMETVFHISNCPEVYQVKYATCTLLDSALTWWNLYKRIVGVDATFAMTWRDIMKLMMEVYYPRNKI